MWNITRDGRWNAHVIHRHCFLVVGIQTTTLRKTISLFHGVVFQITTPCLFLQLVFRRFCRVFSTSKLYLKASWSNVNFMTYFLILALSQEISLIWKSPTHGHKTIPVLLREIRGSGEVSSILLSLCCSTTFCDLWKYSSQNKEETWDLWQTSNYTGMRRYPKWM